MGLMYKLLFLPVYKQPTEGCYIINKEGQVFIYSKDEAWNMDIMAVSEPFLVSSVYNEQKIIGKPSPAVKWLKNGDECKIVDCEEWLYNEDTKQWVMPKPPDMHSVPKPLSIYIRVKCPSCQILH